MKLLKSQRRQRGAAMVEFAMSFLVVILLVFSMFEIIMLMYTYSTLTNAAKEGVRYAIVHGSNSGTPSGPDNIVAVQARVREFAGMSLHDISGSKLSVDVQYLDGDNQTPHRVSVTVSYPYIAYISLPWTLPSIHASAQGSIAN